MKKLKRFLIKLLIKIFGLFPLQNNKIVFCSYAGSSYSCNPRYISEALQKQNEDIDIVWILPEEYPVPQGIRKIQEKTIKGLYELCTAKVWVDNSRKTLWMRKRKEQFYIQAWHGGIALKLVERFVENKLSDEYVESAKNDSKMANLFLSNSKWLSDFYRKGFWYDGEILEKGLPREDILFSNHKKFHEKICQYYDVPLDTRFVLYAPTFRNDGKLDCYDVDYKRLLTCLEETRKGNWRVIIRLHPNIQAEQTGIVYDAMCLNGSKYPEINDLIMASEMFMSDYSSCMFDAMLAGCDVIIYASDIESYKEERGFCFEWEELPFVLATDNESLERCIKEFDKEQSNRLTDKFKNSLGFVPGGHATGAVVDIIMKEMGLSKANGR